MSSPTPVGRPSLKVPRENNRFLCVPVASDSKRLLDSNHLLLAGEHLPKWFHDLRRLAREQALVAAQAYMAGYAPSLAESTAGDLEEKRWVLGGHQPELFHPGVWFKNFLMAEISKQTDAVGFQIIIDHDVARSDSLRIPCGASVSHDRKGAMAQRSVPLPIRAESAPRMPWHATLNETAIRDGWSTTLEIVVRSLTECGLASPMLQSRQRLLADCIAATTNIGDAFSQFRHRIEMDHGVANLEVPIGHLCDKSAFGMFVQHCVANAESLWNAYNQCRDAYRARHKIRNQGQPVLELQMSGNWLELPFWIYRRSGVNVVRHRLWASKQAGSFVLSDSSDDDKRSLSVELPFDSGALPSSWDDLVASGICIRPRALMTTLYLRCFVADLFVHGIGGGTYDELTDDILSEWIGVEPPTYLISSASLFLPFPAQAEVSPFDPSSDWARLQRELHLMRSVPERFLDRNNGQQRSLYDAHARQLERIPVRGDKLDWHIRTSHLKQQIEIAIEPKKRDLIAKRDSMQLASLQAKILNSREYSFVLFDEQDATGRLIKLAQAAFAQLSDSGK